MANDVNRTIQELEQLQSESLARKVQICQTRLMEAYMEYKNNVYTQFSYDSNSAVLADLCARMCCAFELPMNIVFVNTNCEERRNFAFEFIRWLKEKYNLKLSFEILRSPSYRVPDGCCSALGARADESEELMNSWIKNGCNDFELSNTSRAIMVWKSQDVDDYIKQLNILTFEGEGIEQ